MGASMYPKMHSVFGIFSAPADCQQCLGDISNRELNYTTKHKQMVHIFR